MFQLTALQQVAIGTVFVVLGFLVWRRRTARLSAGILIALGAGFIYLNAVKLGVLLFR